MSINYLFIALSIVTLIFVLLKKHSLFNVSKHQVIFYYAIYQVITVFGSELLIRVTSSNFIQLNIDSIVFLLFWGYYFYTSSKQLWQIIVTLVLAVAGLCHTLWLGILTRTDDLTYAAIIIFIAILAVFHLFYLVKAIKADKLTNYIEFWLGYAVLFYTLPTIMLYLIDWLTFDVYGYKLTSEVWMIQNIASFIFNFFIIRSLWAKKSLFTRS